MNPAHTAFASAAIDLAQLFEMFVGTTPLPATAGQPFKVSLTTPHGPSTGKGTQRLQHITFTRGTRTFVAGSIDTVDKLAELRGLDNLAAMHRHRFSEPLPIAPEMYEAFLKRIRAFSASQHLAVVIKEIAQPSESQVLAAAPSGGWWKLLLGLLLVAGAAVGVFFALRYYGYA